MNEQADGKIPSEVFRDNLQRLATAQGLDLDDLATSVGFIRDDKKWLRRAWEDGLARLDKRAMHRLTVIAARLGLGDVYGLWNPQAKDDQATILRSVQYNEAAWHHLVRRIIEYIDALQIFRGMNPRRAKEIEANHDFDTLKMIADWARRGVGSDGSSTSCSQGDDVEVLDTTKLARDYRADSDFRSRVLRALSAKDEFVQMKTVLREQLGPEEAEKEVANRLARCLADPLIESEVVNRFFERHMREFADKETDDSLETFLEEIREHPGWFLFVNAKFKGDEEAAVDSLADMWIEFEQQTGGAVPVENIVRYFNTRILDPFLIEGTSDKEILAEGFSIMKPPRRNVSVPSS